MYKNIDDGAFIGRKQYSVLMFKVNFLGLGLLYSIYIYIYLKHNASLTHVTSFRLMTPRPVGLRALGVMSLKWNPYSLKWRPCGARPE
jgi:hypothetical protein